jgi:hypothetical protein
MKSWYNENEGRAYPMREDSPRIDALGRKLPDDIIADASIVTPDGLEDDVFLLTVSLTPALVTLVIGTATQGLLVGTFPKPLTLYRPLPLDPLTDNVSGFVVLGHGAAAYQGTYSFNDAASTPFAVKALHTFDALPIPFIGKIGSPAQILDLIEIQTNGNVQVRYDSGTNTIYLSLIESVRDAFVGPCAKGDSISGCGIPPIRSINGVTADGNGAITLEVE